MFRTSAINYGPVESPQLRQSSTSIDVSRTAIGGIGDGTAEGSGTGSEHHDLHTGKKIN